MVSMSIKAKYETGVKFFNQGDYHKSFDELNDIYKKINNIKEENSLEKEEICKLFLILSEIVSKKDKNKSILLLEELVSFYNNYIPALLNLADGYRVIGKVNKAIKVLGKIEAIDPDIWQAYSILCQCHITILNFKEAKEAIIKANNLNPNNPFIEQTLDKLHNHYEDEHRELTKKKDILFGDDKNINLDGSFSNEIIQLLQQIGINLIFQGKIVEGINYLKAGPGYLKINGNVPPEDSNNAIVSDLDVVKTPHFIGSWMISDKSICDKMIDHFDSHKASQLDGKMTVNVDKSKKNSKDMSFSPKNVMDSSTDFFSYYFSHLHSCFFDYCSRWPYLRDDLGEFKIGIFNIQKYTAGGHFIKQHAERNNIATQHRYFAFMTYLNDVNEGGETVFPNYDLKVKPQKGNTLIWPSDWTHVHYGDLVKTTDKYIITGWIERH